MGTNDRCWLIIQKLLRIAQPFRERNRAEAICCSALKSICFAMISSALATASARLHDNASLPDRADSSFVITKSFLSSICRVSTSLSRTTVPSAFVDNVRKLSIKYLLRYFSTSLSSKQLTYSCVSCMPMASQVCFTCPTWIMRTINKVLIKAIKCLETLIFFLCCRIIYNEKDLLVCSISFGAQN